LGDEDSAVFLVAQAQRTLAGEGDFGEAQALANLAAALGQAPTPFPSETILTSTQVPSQILTSTASDSLPPTPNYTQTPSPTNVLTSTDTVKQTIEVTTGPAGTATVFGTLGPTRPTTQITYLAPSLTPTATLSPPFVLDNRVEVCNPLLTEPQIQVFVSNTAGIGIPGIEIIISWNGGEEHFYTGIKTDIDIGYADFVMEPEILYVLQVANGGQLIADLTAPQCKNEAGIVFWGSLRLVFTHP